MKHSTGLRGHRASIGRKTKSINRCIAEVLETRRLLASIAGTVFNDIDGDGLIDAGESGLSGWTVYHDANLNGVFDAPSSFPSSDVPRSINNNHTSLNSVSGVSGLISDVNVTINLSHTWVGDLIISLASPTGQEVFLVNQTGGANNSGDNYTNTTFDDEAAAPITSGSPPYTGTFRPVGNLASFDGLNPNGTWELRVNDVFPPADDGVLNSWSISFPGADTAVTTNLTGNYSFSGLGAGTYRIGQVTQSPYLQTSPAGGFHDVTVGASDNATGRNFGNRLPPGEIHGIKWHDLDNDGLREAGEPGLAGVTIYVDLNANGTFESGSEPSAITGGDGSYALTDVPPGDHLVREVVPAGYNQTFPGPFGALTEAPSRIMGPEAYSPPATSSTDQSTDSSWMDSIPRPVWAPGTPQSAVDEYYNRARESVTNASGEDDRDSDDPSAFTFADTNRWSHTATNGFGLSQGQATTLTWRIVADGTPIPGFIGEPSNNSNLRAFLDGIYGSEAVWLPLFQQIFDSWSSLTGINYVMEAADDGSSFSQFDAPGTRGQLGVRADIRIGGHFIDGSPLGGSVLAYNFFPNVGEMVIDTGDNFYSQASSLANNSRGLRNVLAHEHGHGIGIEHVMPVNGTKLMEPFVNLSFDGPQHDDILAANRGYGDSLEQNGGNDTAALAFNLGALGNGTTNTSGVSIDDDSDVDYFRFTAGSGHRATITVNPVGSTYDSGTQGGPPPTPFNSKAQSDLSVQLIAPDGTTILRSANLNGAGFSEVLKNVPLGAGGQYFIRVNGNANAAQLYDFSLTIADALPGTHSVTVASAAVLSGIDFGNKATGGAPPTADVIDINPDPRSALTGVVAINFSENVSNVDIADFTLTRDEGSVSLAGLSVVQLNAAQYTLDLSSVTTQAGSYLLTLNAAGSGIINGGGTPIASNASDGWIMNAINGTGAGDTIKLKRSGGGNSIDVFVNNATATPDYTVSIAGLGPNALNVLGSGGDDVLMLDFVNGTFSPTGGISFDGGASSAGDGIILVGTGASETASFNTTHFSFGVTQIGYSATEKFRFDGGAGGDTLDIDAGTFSFDDDAALTNTALDVNIAAGATANFNATQHLDELSVAGTAHLQAGAAKVLVTTDLLISGAGRLDLHDNDLIVNYSSTSPIGSFSGSAYTGIAGFIDAGRGNAANALWNGNGLVTSDTRAINTGNRTSLGIAEASQLFNLVGTATGSFAGEVVDATAVLVKFSWGGDANLDGKINIDDYGRIDGNVSQSGIVFGWFNGDFNYDGKINIDDYGVIDGNINQQDGVL